MPVLQPFRLIEAPTAPLDLLADSCETPAVGLERLEVLWFQLTGTLCNIQCAHCFISCGPANHDLELMTRAQVQAYLVEARGLGVREYYFTGGEPFLHRELVEILADTLAQGPVTVLTNGMLLTEQLALSLRQTARGAAHPLTFRVSLDGFDAESNDALRGPGAFRKALAGLQLLTRAGFVPILTATRTWACAEEKRMVSAFREHLAAAGVGDFQLKILPGLLIGREAERSRAYGPQERVTKAMLKGYDTRNLLCSHARIATAQGVRVCPILVGAPDAALGQTLAGSRGAYRLRHRACHTCYVHGAICSNQSQAPRLPAAGGGAPSCGKGAPG